jgi:hypothetical protein
MLEIQLKCMRRFRCNYFDEIFESVQFPNHVPRTFRLIPNSNATEIKDDLASMKPSVRYPGNSPINRISMVTSNRNNARIVASSVYTWVHLKAAKETTQFSSVSCQDASDRLARPFPTVQFACSCGTFCKSQCNQQQEPVGEDFSGNQPDQLSGFILLH